MDWIQIDASTQAANLPNGILVRALDNHTLCGMCFVPDLIVKRVNGQTNGAITRKSKDYQDA